MFDQPRVRSRIPRAAHTFALTCALICALTTLSAAGPLRAQSDALAFHATAQATIAAPPPAAGMRVLCTQEVRAKDTPVGVDGWISFVAPPREPSAWIAAVSRARIRNVGNAITTTRLFSPFPTAYPSKAGTLDWAWIWDRNGDGRADYAAYLQNAMGVVPDPLPDSFPKPDRKPDGTFGLNQPFTHALIDHATLVFRHYADDDFDGRADVVVVEEADLDRPLFVLGWVVARASKHDGIVDQAWAFRRGITDTTRVIAPETDGRYRIPDIPVDGPKTVDAADMLSMGTTLLAAINDLNARCTRGPVPIRRP